MCYVLDVADAIELARDAIGVTGIDMEDDNKVLPEPSYDEGIGVEADLEKARYWCMLAAGQNQEEAVKKCKRYGI